MDNDKKQTDIKRGRGRPPLSPDEKEQRRIENNKRTSEYHKSTGYAARKKYHATNPEKVKEIKTKSRQSYDDLHISILKKFRPALDEVVTKTDLSITSLFLNAVEEKYGIKLTDKD